MAHERLDGRADDAADDRVRECSALTLLLPVAGDSENLRQVRARARDLYARSQRTHTHPGRPPTRAELDALWALVPASHERWARGLVDRAMERARRAGLTATPQYRERPAP